MSIHPMSWVLRESEAKLGDRLVLLVLADHASDDGTGAWPSVATIAAEARLSTRQAQRCLRNLVAQGEIEEDGKSKAGTVNWTLVGYQRGRQNVTPEATSTAPRGVTSSTSGGDRMSPEPSLEQPSLEQPSGTTPATLVAEPVYDPLKGRRVNGRDLPWDALAAATQAYGDANGARMRRALASIRKDVIAVAEEKGVMPVEEFIEKNGWLAYEHILANLIETRAEMLRERHPNLTWGPEGIARNWRLKPGESPTDVEAIVADVIGGR